MKGFKIGDTVTCKVGNMGLTCIGKVVRIDPPLKHYPALLYVEGTLNHPKSKWKSSLKWHGTAYSDQVKIIPTK
jgi:hypothetical protein